MHLTVVWPNFTHFLLANPSVTLTVDGVSAPVTLQPGRAEFTVPRGSASPPIATLTVRFAPTLNGPPLETLGVVQHFELRGRSADGAGGPTPTNYAVRPSGTPAIVRQVGQHPLLEQQSAANLWVVRINTSIVDVSRLQPLLLTVLEKLLRPDPVSKVRVLARTDGKLPIHWITATPASCTSFTNPDLLCFFRAPQGSPPARDDSEFYVTRDFLGLADTVGIFLGKGKHDDTLKAFFRDHFARAHNPGDLGWHNQPGPNVVIARGWESALVASDKHVALVLPVASNGVYDPAALVQLPALLSEVFAVLVALGDIAAPPDSGIDRAPRLGIAAHSNGGGALFSAIASSPKAFQEIWLFEARKTSENITTLATADAARVLFAGFDVSTVVGPEKVAERRKALIGRIRRLPHPPLSVNDSPAVLAASSGRLTHALVGGGMVASANDWHPSEREKLQVLHQQIVQGNDADGLHYMTKALKDSVFR